MKPTTLTLAILFSLVVSLTAETKAVLKTDQIPVGGKSLVWSPLFQASWDKLNSRRKGKLVKITPPNALMTMLDSFHWKETEVMPEGGYAVFAGPATAEFAADVRNRVLKQFKYNMGEGRIPTSDRGDAVFVPGQIATVFTGWCICGKVLLPHGFTAFKAANKGVG